MFSKWKARLGALAAFLLAGITWLGFFGIDARAIREKMSTHYLFLIAALFFTCLFAWSVRYLWRNTRVTPENVHFKIRQWLDAFNVNHGVFPFEPWHFCYNVTFWGQRFFVGRPKTGVGRVLSIELRTSIAPDHVKALNELPDFDQRKLKGQVALEIARARIPIIVHKGDYSDFSVTKTLPINAKLSETDFLGTLSEVYYGAMVVWNSIGLQLDKSPTESTPPLLTADKEASPH